MRKNVLILLLALGCLLWSAVCFGGVAKEEWLDKSYDFKQVKTVVVQYSIGDDLEITETEKRNLDDMFKAKFFQSKKAEKIKYISVEQSEEAVEKATGINMKELRGNDDAQYKETLQKHLPIVADAVLKITINRQRRSSRHVSESVYSYKEDEIRTHYIPRYDYQGRYMGRDPVVEKVPVTKYGTIAAHDVAVGQAGAEFVLATTKDQQEVWRLLDLRDEDDKSPGKVTEKIFSRAKDRLVDLAKKK
jgi:hypothetical protein